MQNAESLCKKTVVMGERTLRVERLLGRGKSGYSYLALNGGESFVLKAIHHEPCDYYTFGDKFACELEAYERLTYLDVPLPVLIGCDRERELILKEYLPGPTAAELIERGELDKRHTDAVRALAARLREADINIDYFPANFIERDGTLYYIDYEYNRYMDEWSFDNWGAKYWANGESKTDMDYVIAPMSEADAREICAWRYSGEYAVYDFAPWDEAKRAGWTITDCAVREREFRAVREQSGRLAGFFRMTPDGAGEVEIGAGMRPELCGRGLGEGFLRAVAEYALKAHPGKTLYAEVRTFNLRSMKSCERAGFERRYVHTAQKPWGTVEYVRMEYRGQTE